MFISTLYDEWIISPECNFLDNDEDFEIPGARRNAQGNLKTVSGPAQVPRERHAFFLNVTALTVLQRPTADNEIVIDAVYDKILQAASGIPTASRQVRGNRPERS